MDNLAGRFPDPGFWCGRRVLLTGHTGFKGGWASLWLSQMGAHVVGLALPPSPGPSLWELAGIEQDVETHFVDLRNREDAERHIRVARPSIAIHMAAQPLVRASLRNPVSTFATNVMGTAHVLEALAKAEGLEAVLVVTSDKVYANDDAPVALAESARLGGKDPYSASKASAELVAACYLATRFERDGVPLATARGGNVIGGGDFSADRIIPDIVRAARTRQPVVLRHPEAIRPWQHVIDCVSGYLVYCEALALGENPPSSLNIGPLSGDTMTVEELARAVQSILGLRTGWRHDAVSGSLEARILTLDTALARRTLGWEGRLPGAAAVDVTARWYREWLHGADMRRVTLSQLAETAGRNSLVASG